MNNSSFFTADRATHLKVVTVALLGAIAVMVVGIAARPHVDTGSPQVVKAGPSMLATEAGNATIH